MSEGITIGKTRPTRPNRTRANRQTNNQPDLHRTGPSDVPGYLQRGLLKTALRRFGVRCALIQASDQSLPSRKAWQGTALADAIAVPIDRFYLP
jgi:hypothetical protein